jgi:hypothetical protein
VDDTPTSTIATDRFGRATWTVAEALFAGPGGPPPRERLELVTADLPDFLHHSGLRLEVLFRVALFTVVWLAPLLGGTLPLRYLGWRDRVAALERIERSMFALPFLLVKTILCILYHEHPDAEAEIMGDGPRGLVEAS